jgi:dTDP-4-amino-4,6-dideoxygalactose transaminase
MQNSGHPCEIEEILAVSQEFRLAVGEDADDSLGSRRRGKNPGTFSLLGSFTSNGNEIITTGGGGVILIDNKEN